MTTTVENKGLGNLRIRFTLLIFCIVSTIACESGTPVRLILDDGRAIELISTAHQNFPDDGLAVIVRYRTTLPIEENSGLRDEATELVARLDDDLGWNGEQVAILRATNAQTSFGVTVGTDKTFIFRKQNGTWQLQPSP